MVADEEMRRVDTLIERDRADRDRERLRQIAEAEVAAGNFTNLSDTVIEPTDEWLAKGPTATFIPKQPDGTVRLVKSVRRVLTPSVKRMLDQGKLADDQFAACMWYRGRYDASGLVGRWKSPSLSMTGGSGGGTGLGCAPMAMHTFEAEARQEFRAARAWLGPRALRFFDAVVLEDVPIRRALRFVQVARNHGEATFRAVAIRLVEFCDKQGIDTSERLEK